MVVVRRVFWSVRGDRGGLGFGLVDCVEGVEKIHEGRPGRVIAAREISSAGISFRLGASWGFGWWQQ